MNKWKVEGHHGDHYVLCPTHKVRRGTRWAVINAETGDTREFPNHSEALAYADRAARTVEVTLPRVDRATLLGVAMDFPYMAGVNMSSQEAETLGLTLLALARRKAQA